MVFMEYIIVQYHVFNIARQASLNLGFSGLIYFSHAVSGPFVLVI